MKQTSHPAKFSDALMPVFASMLKGDECLLDPFGGTGKIFSLLDYYPNLNINAIEIEPEWVALDNRLTLGNALALPYPDDLYNAICTSPCLTPSQKILKKDLTWAECGNIKEGDELISFDESSPFIKSNGQSARRKWRISRVIESYPSKKECVRVWMKNGDYIDCTYDHPFLCFNWETGTTSRWIKAKDLMNRKTFVMKQLDIWNPNISYEAGWLAGIFDGEGSLSFGIRGAPKLIIAQVKGEVSDRVKDFCKKLGYSYYVIDRKETLKKSTCKPMENTYISGGFPSILKVLGEIRPERLLKKLDYLDIASRCIEPNKIEVASVENIGEKDIQGIQTSTGTYIGEGYLMHNTYGNAMAGKVSRDIDEGKWHRIKYADSLHRDLSTDNSANFSWGKNYREFHIKAWMESRRVLKNKGIFILNIKNHIRKGVEQLVTEWHIETLNLMGFETMEHKKVNVPSMGFGQHREARVPYESVVKFILYK